MSEMVVLEDRRMLHFIPNKYKTEQMHKKAVNDYPLMLEFIPDCQKTQKMLKNLLILIQ